MPHLETSSRIIASIVTILEGRASPSFERGTFASAGFDMYPAARRIHVTRKNLEALAYHEWSTTRQYGSDRRLKDFSPRWISDVLIMGMRVDVYGRSIIVDLIEVAEG